MNSTIIHSDIINNYNYEKECAVMQSNLNHVFNTNLQFVVWHGGRQGDLDAGTWHGDILP